MTPADADGATDGAPAPDGVGRARTRTRATVEGSIAGGAVALLGASVGGWALGVLPPVVGGALAGYRSPGARLDGAVCGFGVGMVLAAGGFARVLGALGAGTAQVDALATVPFYGALVLAVTAWMLGPVLGFVAAGGATGDGGGQGADGEVGRTGEATARGRR